MAYCRLRAWRPALAVARARAAYTTAAPVGAGWQIGVDLAVPVTHEPHRPRGRTTHDLTVQSTWSSHASVTGAGQSEAPSIAVHEDADNAHLLVAVPPAQPCTISTLHTVDLVVGMVAAEAAGGDAAATTTTSNTTSGSSSGGSKPLRARCDAAVTVPSKIEGDCIIDLAGVALPDDIDATAAAAATASSGGSGVRMIANEGTTTISVSKLRGSMISIVGAGANTQQPPQGAGAGVAAATAAAAAVTGRSRTLPVGVASPVGPLVGSSTLTITDLVEADGAALAAEAITGKKVMGNRVALTATGGRLHVGALYSRDVAASAGHGGPASGRRFSTVDVSIETLHGAGTLHLHGAPPLATAATAATAASGGGDATSSDGHVTVDGVTGSCRVLSSTVLRRWAAADAVSSGAGGNTAAAAADHDDEAAAGGGDTTSARLHVDSLRGHTCVVVGGDIHVSLAPPVACHVVIAAARNVVVVPGLTGLFRERKGPRSEASPGMLAAARAFPAAAASSGGGGSGGDAGISPVAGILPPTLARHLAAHQWLVEGPLTIKQEAPPLSAHTYDPDEAESATNSAARAGGSGSGVVAAGGKQRAAAAASGAGGESGKISTAVPVSGFYSAGSGSGSGGAGEGNPAGGELPVLLLVSTGGAVKLEATGWMERAKQRAAAATAAGGGAESRSARMQ